MSASDDPLRDHLLATLNADIAAEVEALKIERDDFVANARFFQADRDRLAADLARVTAQRDELKKEVRLVHAYKDAALGLVPEDDVHQFFVRVKEIRASRGLPS